MNRRELLQRGLGAAGLVALGSSLRSMPTFAADAIADKDILKDGMPATIANYCQTPDKQPNKACPGWKEKPGHCETCQFFNTDNSLTKFKTGEYAHCQLLADPTKPRYVSKKGWCATYVKKP